MSACTCGSQKRALDSQDMKLLVVVVDAGTQTPISAREPPGL